MAESVKNPRTKGLAEWDRKRKEKLMHESLGNVEFVSDIDYNLSKWGNNQYRENYLGPSGLTPLLKRALYGDKKSYVSAHPMARKSIAHGFGAEPYWRHNTSAQRLNRMPQRQEQPMWTGLFGFKPQISYGQEGVLGKYSAPRGLIQVATNPKDRTGKDYYTHGELAQEGILETTTHELRHRGLDYLRRNPEQIPTADEWSATDPRTGKKITVSDILYDNKGKWSDEGEHNLVKSVAARRTLPNYLDKDPYVEKRFKGGEYEGDAMTKIYADALAAINKKMGRYL